MWNNRGHQRFQQHEYLQPKSSVHTMQTVMLFSFVTFRPDRLPPSCPQTSQGVQPKRFKTLPELVSLYLQPSQGLVTTLLYAVDREETAVSDDRDYSGISTSHASL